MRRPILILTLAFVLSTPAFAQSTITLDSFSIEPAPSGSPQTEAETMLDCLSGDTACSTDEFAEGAAFSLDDIVNLGIIDRAEVQQETALYDPAEPLPSIDLEVFFEYNSATLTASAEQRLNNLSSALTDPRVRQSRIVFIGHTDAVGTAAYNLDLSQRRAEAVAQHVVRVGGFPPGQIEATGVGFSRLKNSADPAAQENRRVQVVLIPASHLTQ